MKKDICAREECQLEFEKNTHNQKYCGAECCRIETNRRIMEKYYARRDQRLGKVRYCDLCRTTKLSRYNDSHICGSCKMKSAEETRMNVLNMVSAIVA